MNDPVFCTENITPEVAEEMNDPVFCTENITPEVAEGYLKFNTKNRNPSETLTKRLVSEISAKNWKNTGDPIKFDIHGVLVDGQHRLYAVIKSGMTVRITVCRGLDPSVIDVIDTGRKRSVADTKKIQGEVDANYKAATINYIGRQIYGVAATVLQVNKIFSRHQAGFRWLFSNRDLSKQGLKTSKHMDMAPVAAALAWAYKFDPAKIEAFYNGLKHGENLTGGSPIKGLRDFLMNRGSRQSHDKLFNYTLAAIYRFIHNETMYNQVNVLSKKAERFFNLNEEHSL